MTTTDLITVSQAAEQLKLGRSTIYELINRGELASVKMGASRRIRQTDLDRFVAEHTEGQPNGIPSRSR